MDAGGAARVGPEFLMRNLRLHFHPRPSLPHRKEAQSSPGPGDSLRLLLAPLHAARDLAFRVHLDGIERVTDPGEGRRIIDAGTNFWVLLPDLVPDFAAASA